MRRALSMIELLFVIILIGILAAISIPKLAATRDDAAMSSLAQNAMTAATEIATYAVSRGQTEDNLSLMSSTVRILVKRGEASQPTTSPPTLNIHWSSVPDCVVIKIENRGSATELLTIEANGTSSDSGCNRLRSLIDTERFPIPLRGSRIIY